MIASDYVMLLIGVPTFCLQLLHALTRGKPSKNREGR